MSAKGKSLTSTERLKHRQNGFFSCQDKFLKSQLLGCKSSMSLTFKIYTDLLRTSLTVIFPQVAGFTRNSRASAPFSTKSSVLPVSARTKKQKTSLVSFFAFLVSFWACFVSPSRSTRFDYARLWPRWQRWWTALRISEKLRYQALPPAPTYTLKSTTKQDKTSRRHAQVKREKTTQVTEFHLSVWRFRSASKRTTRRGALSVFPHVRSHARFMRDLYISYLFP